MCHLWIFAYFSESLYTQKACLLYVSCRYTVLGWNVAIERKFRENLRFNPNFGCLFCISLCLIWAIYDQMVLKFSLQMFAYNTDFTAIKGESRKITLFVLVFTFFGVFRRNRYLSTILTIYLPLFVTWYENYMMKT